MTTTAIDHEFYDKYIQQANCHSGEEKTIELRVGDGFFDYIELTKKDAIAIAKALGVTAKDLEGDHESIRNDRG